MSDIVSDIERAIGCQHCGGPLGDSPSRDFCRQECQEDWRAERAEPLPFPSYLAGLDWTPRMPEPPAVDTAQFADGTTITRIRTVGALVATEFFAVSDPRGNEVAHLARVLPHYRTT
ncbi:hypothetical protein ORV05_04820 [Amycolatopsis cynarae]|uniref:DUF2116 family Zn-ribbon domain-containing protein n=1 Tax=Amycolatopsis cynarae TaxID=2995223 RepID=A0ABY7B469_9PSEU|nr:hypothetical protein [Amycolatopsis sp. HUAS 11-8]WAL67114.1 hypothetical protein ORV05_04820 [Amycolatopsis sp. HUAS 11-8]